MRTAVEFGGGGGDGEGARVQAEGEAVGELRFESSDAALRHDQVFHPDLGAILDPDHLRPEAEMRGQGAQGSGEDEVGFEGLADLLSAEALEGQHENRIPGEDCKSRRMCVAQPDHGFLGDSGAKMLGDTVTDGEGWDGQPRERIGRRDAVRAHLGGKTVSALVDGLNALFRLKPRAQRGEALGNAVGGDMHIAPQGLAQLEGRNDLAGAGYEETERRQLLGGQMNDRLSAQEGAVGLEPEACKGKLSIQAASIGRPGLRFSRAGQS